MLCLLCSDIGTHHVRSGVHMPQKIFCYIPCGLRHYFTSRALAEREHGLSCSTDPPIHRRPILLPLPFLDLYITGVSLSSTVIECVAFSWMKELSAVRASKHGDLDPLTEST